MKRLLLLLLICLFSFKGIAQDYTPMFEIGKTWNMYLHFDYPDGIYFDLTVTETVEIDGLTYYHIEASHHNCDSFLREDIDEKKIYGIWEGEEYLHYDFSLGIGDYMWVLGNLLLITDIGSGDFFGMENLRYLVLENQYKLIEGIGFESFGIADSFEYGCLNNPLFEWVELINMNQPLGIHDIMLEKITFYPNPAQDLLTIENKSNIEITSIKLYDVLGRLALEEKGNVKQIDISHLNSGVLFVEIETEHGVVTKKVIKK